jgi:hypothetical protein
MTTSNGTSGATGRAEPDTVAVVLDKSGSMGPLREAVVAAYNAFLTELGNDACETRVSLTMFDTNVNHVYVAQPLTSVPPLRYESYRPGGMTALLRWHGRLEFEAETLTLAEAHLALAALAQLPADAHSVALLQRLLKRAKPTLLRAMRESLTSSREPRPGRSA